MGYITSSSKKIQVGIFKDKDTENEVKENIFEIKNTKKNRLDSSFIFVDFRDFSKDTPKDVPNVHKKHIPPNIAINKLRSAKRHQLYSPKANNATIANAIMLGITLNFIVLSI